MPMTFLSLCLGFIRSTREQKGVTDGLLVDLQCYTWVNSEYTKEERWVP